MRMLYLAVTVGMALTTTQAMAQTPIFHWGSDTRAMSQPECMKRAKFALGEVGLRVNGETSQDVAGAGPDVAVIVTCLSLGQRTYISVTAASPDSGTAERARNTVRSITMGPAD
jgi:hypothetical protein